MQNQGMNNHRNEKAYEIGIQKALQERNNIGFTIPKEFEQVRQALQYFLDQGVKIIFFEMPMDYRLAKLRSEEEQREFVCNNFNSLFLPLPKHQNFYTTDGIHLLPKSALDFTKVFLDSIKQAAKCSW